MYILRPKYVNLSHILVIDCLLSKLLNGSRVGQVGPVTHSGQVKDLDPSNPSYSEGLREMIGIVVERVDNC